MSERPLPDDLSLWPDDPNDLLGVPHDASPRQLRQAYNRLIRIYKPEQAPEPFRRIREAYESLLRMAELFGPCHEVPDPPAEPGPQVLPASLDEPSEAAGEWGPEDDALEEDQDEEDVVPSWASAADDELDELWESAIQGQPSPAYERLVQLHQQYAGRTEVYLRLYWLLTLSPELDMRRVPVDWLVQGLLETGHAGPLHELYADELADDPAEALSERFERLLQSSLRGGPLADLAERRFQAVVRLRRWDILSDDLRELRRRFGVDEAELWLRLLFTLADELAWAEDAEAVDLMALCREEIVRHEHLASALSYAFDRFDLLVEAAQGWHRLRRGEGGSGLSFLRLLSVSWFRPFPEVRGLLAEALEAIVAAPGRWLNYFDRMCQQAPTTLALFGELLDQFEQVQEMVVSPRDKDELTDLVQTFLSFLESPDYDQARDEVLAFCLGEAVVPEEMAEVANGFIGDWEELGAVWAQALTADWPLRYVCRASRLFWG
jgi:hypothetical protein